MEVDWEEEEEEAGAEDDGSDVGTVPNMMLRSLFQREPFWLFFMVAAGEGRTHERLSPAVSERNAEGTKTKP